MRKIEKNIIALLIFPAPILFCMLIAALSIFIGDIKDPFAVYLGLSSIALGVLIDIFFLTGWVKKAYEFGDKVLAFGYIFYSIIAWGMGMGVPLLNFGVGILAGVFIALKLNKNSADEHERKQKIKKCAFFTAAVLIFVCCLSGFWAIIGGLVGGEFEIGAIKFNFTATIIIALTLTGGFVLALLQYWLTKAAAATTLRLKNGTPFEEIPL
jgi:hypothetical protein